MRNGTGSAHKNKDLWWRTDESGRNPIALYLADFFGDVNLLNEILIDFPIVRKDVNDKETKMVLQLLSEDQCAKVMGLKSFDTSVVDLHGLYGFRFIKYENIVNMRNQNILNPRKIDTKKLLDELQNVLMALEKDDFKVVTTWVEDL